VEYNLVQVKKIVLYTKEKSPGFHGRAPVKTSIFKEYTYVEMARYEKTVLYNWFCGRKLKKRKYRKWDWRRGHV
jgi:hypothetical protein